MTHQEFIDILNDHYYSWKGEVNTLIVTEKGEIDLEVDSIPPNIEFRNHTFVHLDSLVNLPDNIGFKNGGSVSLFSLESIPPGTIFENGRGIYLDKFNINTFEESPVIFHVENISPKRILNKMIADGLLNRNKK